MQYEDFSLLNITGSTTNYRICRYECKTRSKYEYDRRLRTYIVYPVFPVKQIYIFINI
jgi:hypothetical protein